MFSRLLRGARKAGSADVDPAATSTTHGQSTLLSDAERWNDFFTAFGCNRGEGAAYLEAHFKRYEATLQLIEGNSVRRILELGGSFPYAFSLMLRRTFPEAELFLGNSEDNAGEHLIPLHNKQTGEELLLPSRSFNVERDAWPFETKSFDVVLCMELIEHLVLDPCFVFREAHRVLRPGGQFIVTTPNIASYEAVTRLWNLEAPYSFGVYSRHGAYGRHNREYAPMEIKALGESSGFTADVLTTLDVYPPGTDTKDLPPEVLEALSQPHLRQQNIFYRGIRQERAFGPYPPSLFDFDADMHRARIEPVEMPERLRVEERLKGIVKVYNDGSYTWTPAGDTETWLGIMLLDRGGRVLIRDFRRADLERPAPPGSMVELAFDVAGHGECGDFLLRFDMVHERICWFSASRPGYLDVPMQFIEMQSS